MCCNDTIKPPDIYKVLDHLKLHYHRTNSGLKETYYKLFCSLCKKYFKRNSNFCKHTKECAQKFPIENKQFFKEYECNSCKLAIFGDLAVCSRYHKDCMRGFQRKKKNNCTFILFLM